MASVASSLRTVIVDANITNITNKVYRDYAPDSASFPLVTFSDDLSRGVALAGDGVITARERLIQVDLWQNLDSEDVTLVESLLAAVDSADLTGADKTVFRCRVGDVQRLAQVDQNVCHHALSVNVTHTN